MPIETIEFKGEHFPLFQSTGNAARFVIPFAHEICKGTGYDIGCNRREWALPGSMPIDPILQLGFDAYTLPPLQVDYIFSSHCLEHLRDWVEALDYWKTKLRQGGVLFLYLPAPQQTYWKSWNNRKHIHNLTPEIIREYLVAREWKNIFVTPGHDLNYSFTAIAEK